MASQGVSNTAPFTALPRSSPLAPLQYSAKSGNHLKTFGNARDVIIRSALEDCPFMTDQERKVAALEALTSAANDIDQGKMQYLKLTSV
jgi:hypothetical protein